MAFHAKDGWFFRRNEDGSVTIALCPPPRNEEERRLFGAPDDELIGGSVKERVTLDAASWQSIIASVSAEGEDNYRFFVAQKFHMGGMKRCAHILGEGFVGTGHPCGLFHAVHYMLDHDHRFVEPTECDGQHDAPACGQNCRSVTIGV